MWNIPLDRSQINTSRLSGHSLNPPPAPTSSNSNQTCSRSFISNTYQLEVNNFVGDTSQPEANNFIGDTSQVEVNSFIGDTSQQEVNNSIGDTSQTEVNNACSSTPVHSVSSNPLVLSGIVPASVMESFILPEFNVRGKKQPRVNTKARMITSDEHVEAYNEKLEKIRLDQEAKENRRKETERKRLEREKRGKVKTRGGYKRRGLNTRGGKVNVGPAKIPRSTRNRRPLRFIDDSNSEVSSESTEEEDWTCQDCLKDDGVAADYVGCDTCERWYHKKCVNKSELDIFLCKFCLEK